VTIDLLPLVSFVLITIFTPGPNNITSTSMGLLYGYRKSLPYLLGIASGFFLLLLLAGWISGAMLELLPSFERYLRIAGALYILWLAIHTLKISYSFETDQQPLFGFGKGFFLQMLNPKGVVFGLTVYTTFLSGVVSNLGILVLSAILFSIAAFVSISTWNLFGTTIGTFLKSPRLRKIVNTILFLLLVYTAIEISGVLDWFGIN